MTLLFLEADWSTSIWEDLGFILLILQFFVGVVELLIALILTIIAGANKKPMRGLLIYWVLVFIYFLVLAILTVLIRENSGLPESVAIAWFFSAWGIAIYFPFHKRFDRKPTSPTTPFNNQEQTNNKEPALQNG